MDVLKLVTDAKDRELAGKDRELAAKDSVIAAQAREIANRDKVQINYYSIIYEVIDDVKALLGGLMSPVIREQFIGYANFGETFFTKLLTTELLTI